MKRRLTSLPVALRVLLLAAAAVFLFVAATSQVALRLAGQWLDREAEHLGRVYPDGLSAAVLPAVRAGDRAALDAALDHALGFQAGIRERRLVIGSPEGEPITAAGIGPEPGWLAPFMRGQTGSAWEIAVDRRAAWAQRPLVDDGQRLAILAARLDIAPIARRGHEPQWTMFAPGLMLAVLGGALAAFGARRAMRPVLGGASALDRAGAGHISRIPPAAMPPAGTEAARLAGAFNAMVAHVAEREALARRLADRDRAATLGRLAATVAHEARNPLAGTLTALESVEVAGHDAAERERRIAGRGARIVLRIPCMAAKARGLRAVAA